MPTIITHAIASAALGKTLKPKQGGALLLMSALCGVMPDFDAMGHHLGVPYLSAWGHRGLTHSLAFAVVFGALCALFMKHKSRLERGGWALYFALLTATHPLLDMLTTGGHGVALFAPHDHARHFFPHAYRVIRVSPMSFSAIISWDRMEPVVMSELRWVVAPSLALLMAVSLIRKLLMLARQRARPLE